MQTFLPYPDFVDSARALDYRRLGKQRVECKQLLKALLVGGGWANHPCAKQWRGYELSLTKYYNIVVEEWIRRGYRNTMPIIVLGGQPKPPPWLGDFAYHASHRSNLLRKDPKFYGKYGWAEEPSLPYIWPSV